MEKKIGENRSSGAEKVERIAHGDEALRQQAEREERAAADARCEAARARAAKKEAARLQKSETEQKKLAERQKTAEERAERQSERAERLARRAARREVIESEGKAERQKRLEREKRERRAQAAQKAESRERERAQKQQSREAARERRVQARRKRKEERRGGRAPGIGGWIAAVSVLGAACLALSVAVTAGALRIGHMQTQAENAYRATLYELVSVAEDMDDRLAKLRIAAGANEQRVLFTGILVDSELMESALEKMPVDAAAGADISLFVNHTNAFARRMLYKLAHGQTLTDGERAAAERLYEANAKLAGELNDLALHTPAEELRAFFEGGAGGVQIRLGELGKGMHLQPERISDAPFAGEGNVEENALIGIKEISQARAEALAGEYFSGYRIAEIRCTGETAARDMTCYNFSLTDESGSEIFAQIAKRGGKLAFFDTYEECTQKNFDMENCDALARSFLAGLGYEGLTPVWFSETGRVANLTYVAETDGVRVYPDMIRVRVCEEKGRVVGMDARGYLVNHHGKRETSPGISADEARARLGGKAEVRGEFLALIPAFGREVLAYEFFCEYGGEQYVVYLDAHSGEEVRIFRVHQSAQGSYLS